MRLLDESIGSVRSRPSARRMMAMLLVLSVFLVQMLALGSHQHAIADDDADCPTCQLVIDAPLLPPSLDELAVSFASPGRAYRIHLTQYRSSTQSNTFLTPPSHAPPRSAT